MGVHVTVREKAEEVQGGGVCLNVADKSLPGLGGKHLAGFNGLRDQLGALSKNLAGAEGVVAYLGVAHVVVRGKADSRAVSLETNGGIFLHNAVKRGGIGLENGVAFGFGGKAYAIHNDGENRAAHTGEACKLVQLIHRCILSIIIFYPVYYTLFCSEMQGVFPIFSQIPSVF